jgi:hypothetical protein
MPLYMLYIWEWAQAFGTSEYALRASNIPFAFMFTTALGWTSYRVFRRPFLWVVFALSPFVVFYMSEARPYVALMACATASTGAMLAYFADPSRYAKGAPWICLVALVIACGLHMLAGFLVPSLMIYAALAIRDAKLDPKVVLRDWTNPLLVCLPLLLAIGVYDAWTVMAGAGGKRGHPGAGNMAFVVWEFMGFAGLGPPRNELRADRSLHALIPYWPWLTVGILAAAAGLGTITMRLGLDRPQRASWRLLLAIISGIALLLVMAGVVRFEFWGRHLAVFFPGLVFVVICLASTIPVRPWVRTMEHAALALLVIAWGISDARIVDDPRYYKDDYRFAARTALDEVGRTGGTMVWAADANGARYYGIDVGPPGYSVLWPVRGKGVYAANWTDGQIGEYITSHERQGPVILVLSKPDLFDQKGAWAAEVQRMHARKIASANSFDLYAFQ